MTADTPGKRVYLIRLALGDGFKVPMPMAAFAALLSKRSGVGYDSSMISRMESGDRKVTLEDVPRLAAIDPLRRGATWLAWGEETIDRKLSAEEITRARAAVAAEDAVAKTTTTPAKKRNHR